MDERAVVLVVDDDTLVRELLRECLEPHFEVVTASSGGEALVRLAELDPHVLVADQRMPGMTGVALAARVRDLRPHTVTVLLSAYSDPRDFIAAINDGQVFRFVSKPWDHNDLVLTVRHAAERSRLSRENAALVAERDRRLHALEILQAVVTAAARGRAQHPALILLARLREVVSFDVAAALLVPSGGEPTLELESAAPVSERNLLELRDRALALFELAAPGALDEARLRVEASCVIGGARYAAVESQAQVPLVLSEQPVGMLVLQSFAPDAFPADVGRLLDVLANGAAEVLQQIRQPAGRQGGALARAVSALGEGLVVTDATGEAVIVNAAARRLLGRAGTDLAGLWRAAGLSAAALGGGGAASREVTLGGLALRLASAPLPGGDGGAVLTVQDLTLEKEREARRLRFVSTVSHEIRTPLSAVVATVDLLLHGPAGEPTSKQRTYLQAAAGACETLHAVVDDLIDLEKHAAGGMALSPRSFDLVPLAGLVVSRFEAAARESGMRLALRAPRAALRLEADPVRVEQVIGNLVSNAIKYALEGTEIVVELGASSTPEGWLVLGVHNAGEVVSVHDLETIFDRFGTQTPRRPGARSSGLGLAICRTLVTAHGGVVAAESAHGTTSFWVALPPSPLPRAPAPPAAAAPVWVAHEPAIDRIALLASAVRAGLPARLLPLDPELAAAAREALGAGLVLAGGPGAAPAARPCVALRRATRAEVETLVGAMAALVRAGGPRLLLAREPDEALVAALGALGVTVEPSEDRGEGLEPRGTTLAERLESLAAELAGHASGAARAVALLRRGRGAGAAAVAVLVLQSWEGFVAAYGAGGAGQLRAALVAELGRRARADGAGPRGAVAASFVAAGERGFVLVGPEPRVRSMASELPGAFQTLVLLHARREDREQGHIALGPQHVPLPSLAATLLEPGASDDDVLRALGDAE